MEENENNEKNKTGANWNKRVAIAQIVSNIFLFIAVVISFCMYKLTEKSVKEQLNLGWSQLMNTKDQEKRDNAIELINKVYNSEFLISLTELKSCASNNNENRKLTDAENLVSSTYLCVAIFYNANLADRTIIEKAFKPGVCYFVGSRFYHKNSKSYANDEIEKMISCMNSKK
jgi:hypothetical protein